ncbi:MAG: hypothetical protein HYV63_12875 [Candidatus Schekmanbacteria bacterium]|nr:hypothetical protein [Candidatus Schekmanbacteria bacterium]
MFHIVRKLANGVSAVLGQRAQQATKKLSGAIWDLTAQLTKVRIMPGGQWFGRQDAKVSEVFLALV